MADPHLPTSAPWTRPMKRLSSHFHFCIQKFILKNLNLQDLAMKTFAMGKFSFNFNHYMSRAEFEGSNEGDWDEEFNRMKLINNSFFNSDKKVIKFMTA